MDFPTNGSHEELAEEEYLPVINRMAVVIRPKRPYIEWANSLDGEVVFGEDDFREDCTALLIPVFEYNEDARSYVHENYEEIFEHELLSISVNPDDWPEDLTLALFLDWFTVEVHSIVMDIGEDPIRYDEEPE